MKWLSELDFNNNETGFNEEQTIAQQNNGKQMKSIQTRYAQEYTNIDQLITEKQLALAKQFSDIDKDTRDANKQLFAAKLRVAKTKQKFEPYRKLTFKNFIKTLIFNKAA